VETRQLSATKQTNMKKHNSTQGTPRIGSGVLLGSIVSLKDIQKSVQSMLRKSINPESAINSVLEKLGGKSSETQSRISPAANDVNSKPDSRKSLEPSISVRMRCLPKGVYANSKLSPSQVKSVIHPARLKRLNKLRKSSKLGIGGVMLPNEKS
jgi:hypothetical protein